MTRPGKPGPVVVGVDEAGSAEDAADWATAEAAARGCPLRAVHAFRPPLPTDAYGFATHRHLRHRTHGGSADPGDAATRALIAESSGAVLPVVGSSSRGHLRGLQCGWSVERSCATRAAGRHRRSWQHDCGSDDRGPDDCAADPCQTRGRPASGSTGRPRRQVFWIHRASRSGSRSSAPLPQSACHRRRNGRRTRKADVSNSSDPTRVDARAEAQLGDGSWLTEVAQSACRDVGGVPVELLGDYLPLLADAATSGRRPHPAELDAVGLLGRRAAELGVSAGSAVQLYLSAARRLWQQLPMVCLLYTSPSPRDRS